MKTSLRIRAIDLRKQGWSYNIIAQRLQVAKSTLSHWLREVPYTPNAEVRKRIQEGPATNAMASHERKMQEIAAVKAGAIQEIGAFTKRDLWMLGLGVYIGEGSKLYENIKIINADPEVIRLAIAWFRRICGLRAENFTIAVHLYPDNPQRRTLKFWSDLTDIPLSQFGKTQVDKRTNKSGKKQRRLPYGTAHVTIRSRGNSKFGKTLHRRILGWIEAAYKHTRVSYNGHYVRFPT